MRRSGVRNQFRARARVTSNHASYWHIENYSSGSSRLAFGDAIAILRAHGANGFRLRLLVNPNDSDVQVNDLPYTLQLAGRIRSAGAMLLLDFHIGS